VAEREEYVSKACVAIDHLEAKQYFRSVYRSHEYSRFLAESIWHCPRHADPVEASRELTNNFCKTVRNALPVVWNGDTLSATAVPATDLPRYLAQSHVLIGFCSVTDCVNSRVLKAAALPIFGDMTDFVEAVIREASVALSSPSLRRC
jgi:hypothetical protein